MQLKETLGYAVGDLGINLEISGVDLQSGEVTLRECVTANRLCGTEALRED